jgi:serine/threonine protein kinase
MQIKDTEGNVYLLSKKLSAGGQGVTFCIDKRPRILAKGLIDPKTEDRILSDKNRYDLYANNVRSVLSQGELFHVASPLVLFEKPYCGYVLEFMEEMEPIGDVMLPKTDEDKKDLLSYINSTGGIKRRLLILKNLAAIFCRLSEKGLVYSDLSPSNVFISKDIGSSEVWLIDADNIHYNNENNVCIGTMNYRAPEVASGHPNSIAGDEYSFALLAFEFLAFNKAFDGKSLIETDPADSWGETSKDPCLLAEEGEYPWVADAKDESNCQLSGIRPFKDRFCPELFSLFSKTFEEGKKHPEERPTFFEWERAFDYAYRNVLVDDDFHFYFHAGKEKTLPFKTIYHLSNFIFLPSDDKSICHLDNQNELFFINKSPRWSLMLNENYFMPKHKYDPTDVVEIKLFLGNKDTLRCQERRISFVGHLPGGYFIKPYFNDSDEEDPTPLLTDLILAVLDKNGNQIRKITFEKEVAK